MLTKIQILFIRACKSKNSETRLLSLYRRFYLTCPKEEAKEYMADLLSEIVQDNNLIKLTNLIGDLSPTNYFYSSFNFNEKVFHIMIHAIRFAEIKKFDGFISPVRYRREENEITK